MFKNISLYYTVGSYIKSLVAEKDSRMFREIEGCLGRAAQEYAAQETRAGTVQKARLRRLNALASGLQKCLYQGDNGIVAFSLQELVDKAERILTPIAQEDTKSESYPQAAPNSGPHLLEKQLRAEIASIFSNKHLNLNTDYHYRILYRQEGTKKLGYLYRQHGTTARVREG